MTAVTASELEASYATRAVDTEAPTPPGFCSCRSGQALSVHLHDTYGPARAKPFPENSFRECHLFKESERKLAPMTVSSPNVIEFKLDRLIDDMRLLRSQMIAFDNRLKGIELYSNQANRANNSRRANRDHGSRQLLARLQGQF